MSKVCIQCERKIGMFKTPIEGVYCSYDCRNAARDAIKENERQSQERIVAAQRRQQEEAAESERRAAVARAEASRRSNCPKCGSAWAAGPAGSQHANHGSCSRCGFRAEFVAIHGCPVCHCQSLVVSPDHEARCPRCKYRQHGARVAV